ncbi:MAG TPA: S41 family peptidase [Solirubrobacterales bacterium]|nr:S41 family peptidase [Solirubrobacterales bacterium]
MRARGAIAFGVALIAFLVLGVYLGGHPSKLPSFARETFTEEPTSLVAEASEIIRDNYFRKVGDTELGNASLQGMVRELRKRHKDRFSDYFSPESLEGFNQQIEGRFSGIGLSVVSAKRGLHVVKVFKGSPAEKGGIEAGDTIVSVEGESIAGLDSTAATGKIKGPEGSEVTIGVEDGKTHKVSEKTLVRAEVELPNVSSRTFRTDGRTIGYVRLFSFSADASKQLAHGIEKVKGEGAEGLVLDLRENPGGLLDEAVATASLFLPEGQVVVTTKSRTKGDSTKKTSAGKIVDVPFDVLVDRNTASSAEILTAALNEDGDATVVGTRTYGKGVFQEEHDLENGGALKLTVGEFFTPNGENLARTGGIHPEVKVVDKPGTAVDEARQKALETVAAQVTG